MQSSPFSSSVNTPSLRDCDSSLPLLRRSTRSLRVSVFPEKQFGDGAPILHETFQTLWKLLEHSINKVGDSDADFPRLNALPDLVSVTKSIFVLDFQSMFTGSIDSKEKGEARHFSAAKKKISKKISLFNIKTKAKMLSCWVQSYSSCTSKAARPPTILTTGSGSFQHAILTRAVL